MQRVIGSERFCGLSSLTSKARTWDIVQNCETCPDLAT